MTYMKISDDFFKNILNTKIWSEIRNDSLVYATL